MTPAKPRAWQRMLSGRRLDLIDPSPLDVEIADIAHGLARVARWNGQTRGPEIFSVAQHSLLVEAIFAAEAPAPPRAARLAALLHDAPEYVIGDMISPFKAAIGGDYKLVEKRLMASAPSPVPWYFPATDAVIADKAGRQGKTRVQIFQAEDDFTNRILVAGCDPGISVLSRHVQAAGIELVLAHRNSSQALALLKEGCVHVAGTHLRDEASGESNLPAIGRLFRERMDPLDVIRFRDLYIALEETIDAAEDAAEVLERIIAKGG